MTDWDELAGWWVDEAADSAYCDDVQPLVDRLLVGCEGPVLDLGCGDGRLTPSLPNPVYGVDGSMRLCRAAAANGVAVVTADVTDLRWVRSGAVQLAVACLVVEHLVELDGFFAGVHRVVDSGGSLVVVSNHPAFTAPGAGPVVDPNDGEVTWRWGSYFIESVTAEPAGPGHVLFHHRPLSALVNVAARHGWKLDTLVERPASAATIARIPALAGQEHMPRLVGIRWSKPSRR